MRRHLARFVVAGILVAGSVTPTSSQDNPLLGTWTSVTHATGAGPASVNYLTFRSDWRYEMRIMVGTNDAGTGSGVAVTEGGYELTVNYWEPRYQVCPSGGYCSDYPNPLPDSGKKKAGTYQMVSSNQMEAEGLLWTRQ